MQLNQLWIGLTLQKKAAFFLVFQGGGGCEYRARRRHRSLLGLSRI
jgi:hypothetical protein